MDRNAILDIIAGHIHTVEPSLAGQVFSAEDSMAAIGIDSVSRQEVLILSMESLNLNLPLVQLFGPRNLGELADLLHGKLSG